MRSFSCRFCVLSWCNIPAGFHFPKCRHPKVLALQLNCTSEFLSLNCQIRSAKLYIFHAFFQLKFLVLSWCNITALFHFPKCRHPKVIALELNCTSEFHSLNCQIKS